MAGRSYVMWKWAVEKARDGRSVLVCVHNNSMLRVLASYDVDMKASEKTGVYEWRFDSGGYIRVVVPTNTAFITGHRFDAIAIDHHAERFYSLAQWEDHILTRLQPNWDTWGEARKIHDGELVRLRDKVARVERLLWQWSKGKDQSTPSPVVCGMIAQLREALSNR